MQTENPVYEEIQEILRAVELPSVALVGQRIDSPPALADIREGVREALNSVELPSGSVAIGVGSRGVARIGEVVAALVEALKDSGAEPFIVPAMGSHGASTAEGSGGGACAPRRGRGAGRVPRAGDDGEREARGDTFGRSRLHGP